MRRCPLVIAMPVYRRAWALPAWFDSLEANDPPDGTRLLFLLTPSEDGTEQVIARRAPGAEVIYVEGLPCFEEDEKDDPRRFGVLAFIRNRLLRAATSLSPERLLSWDSDITLKPGALRALHEAPGDVVGALVDMGGEVYPGHWSWMRLADGDAYRPGCAEDGRPRSTSGPEPFRAGVVMGAKLLSPHVYRTARYSPHLEGEDVGFALCCKHLGIERWVAPLARGEHHYRLSRPVPPMRVVKP